MCRRIPSTLMRSIEAQTGELIYVERPSWFQQFSYNWERSGRFGRIGLSLGFVCASPLLLLGALVSLLVLAMDLSAA